MPRKDVLLAVVVALIWGVNFVVLDKGLEGIPPLLFAAIRFMVVLVPAIFIIPRPQVPWQTLAGVGIFLNLGQFALLYSALAAGMPAGLASVIAQAQVMFSVLIAAIALRERPLPRQIAGIAIGVAGLVVVAAGRSAQTPVVGIVLTLAAALSWATGNVASRQAGVASRQAGAATRQAGVASRQAGVATVQAGVASGLAITVWSAVFAPIPLFGLALLVNGPHEVARAVSHFTVVNGLSTLYTAGLASLVGYGIWNTLLARHPAASVVPFTLLIPPIGLAAAWIALGERPGVLESLGAVVLLAGVAVTAIPIVQYFPAPVRKILHDSRPAARQ